MVSYCSAIKAVILELLAIYKVATVTCLAIDLDLQKQQKYRGHKKLSQNYSSK